MNIYAMDNTDRMLLGWEVPASWFQSLNAMFIIFLGTSVALYWANRKLRGKVATSLFKMIIGLIIMGTGFFFMTAAAGQYESNGASAMYWLVLAYLFHTLGEMCLSPMGLSYLSKLIPARMIAFMFGVYYLAIAIGNKLAHYVGGDIEKITTEHGLSFFFLIFTLIPIGLGLISLMLHPLLKKLMHGVR